MGDCLEDGPYGLCSRGQRPLEEDLSGGWRRTPRGEVCRTIPTCEYRCRRCGKQFAGEGVYAVATGRAALNFASYLPHTHRTTDARYAGHSGQFQNSVFPAGGLP